MTSNRLLVFNKIRNNLSINVDKYLTVKAEKDLIIQGGGSLMFQR